MTLTQLQSELVLPRPVGEIFPFFADARNLERITPEWLQFHVLAAGPIVMQPGTRIDYQLRVHGFPVRWQSEITAWEPPYRFVDEQRRGPYRLWVHEHTFEPHGNDTLCRDGVRYAVWGGRLVERLFVRRDVERIFDFRAARLREIFGG